MEYFPPALEKMVEQFARLPGIGHKTAQRLAFFVLSLPENEVEQFAQAILEAKRSIALFLLFLGILLGLLPASAGRGYSPRRARMAWAGSGAP